MSNFRNETLLREKLGFDQWTVSMARHLARNSLYLGFTDEHGRKSTIQFQHEEGEVFSAQPMLADYCPDAPVYGLDWNDLLDNLASAPFFQTSIHRVALEHMVHTLRHPIAPQTIH